MDMRRGRREYVCMLEAGLEWSGAARKPRRRRSAAERRLIVEETLAPGSSVARVAREHGINANQVFQWRRLYRDGRLTGVRHGGAKLLPVTVADAAASAVWEQDAPLPADRGAIHIELPGRAVVSLEGRVDASLACAVLELLRR